MTVIAPMVIGFLVGILTAVLVIYYFF